MNQLGCKLASTGWAAALSATAQNGLFLAREKAASVKSFDRLPAMGYNRAVIPVGRLFRAIVPLKNAHWAPNSE
jgi:hypothetical protein